MMPPTKRKPSARRTSTTKQARPDASVTQEQASAHDGDEGDVSRWLQSAQPSVAPVRTEPGPTEEARMVAYAVHNHQDRRDVRFEPLPGAVLMFGYSGLSRVLNGYHMVHIATVDELAGMSDQQIYDAVIAAGGKR